jgi:hypothetical protein
LDNLITPSASDKGKKVNLQDKTSFVSSRQNKLFMRKKFFILFYSNRGKGKRKKNEKRELNSTSNAL